MNLTQLSNNAYVLYNLIYAASEGGSWGPLEGVLGASRGVAWKRGELDTSWGPLGGPFPTPPESAVNNRVRGA